jgi:hypothetical protein
LFSNLIASLTDRAKLATLASNRAANARLLKVLYWMRAAQEKGCDLGAVVDEALTSYADSPKHRELVRASLLRNYDIATKLGCLQRKNLARMRHGRSPTVGRGPYRGEKAEVDHIVPRARAPELDKDFANLELLPVSLNRRKAGRVTDRQAAFAKRLAHAGVLTLAAAEILRSVVVGRVHSNRSSTASGTGFSSGGSRTGGGADPRLIIPRVQALTEHMEDWEGRTSASLEAGEYTCMQAGELVSRVEAQGTAAHNRAEEDRLSIQRLEREMNAARERLNEARGRARKAAETSVKTRQAAMEAVSHWQGQLHAARRWLARAQAAEASARAARDAARAALSRAQSELIQAEAELRAARNRVEPCGRDDKGQVIYRPIDTSAYERAVRAAEQRVRNCEHHLAEAEAAFVRAVAERQAAEARVDACTRAVEAATEGEAIAARAVEASVLAESFADRGREEYERAAEVTRRAAARVEQEVEAAGEMRERAANARSQQAAAQSSLSRAYEMHADARNRSCQGRMEMEWRLEQLRAFDAPFAVF